MIDFIASLHRDGEVLIAAVRESDLGTAVPPCPGWQLRDLALHQGEVWRWAVRCINADAHVERPDPVLADAELADWMTEGLQAICALLSAADLDAPRWTFGPKPRTMAFWPRRMAHEVSVHRWDAQLALGQALPIDAELACDGIDEVRTVFIPRQVHFERLAPLTQAITLQPSDGPAITIGEGSSVATVTGTASDLLLALWRRVPADALRIEGDRETALAILASPLTP